jgi:hypothetical protein
MFSLLLAGPASNGPLVESTICEKYAKRAANFVQQCKVRMSSQGIRVIKLDHVEISAEPWNWEFAITQRDQITRYFAHKKKEQPALWNGRVLLMHRCTLSNRVLRGGCFTTEFANFLAWRDSNYPDSTIRDFFAVLVCVLPTVPTSLVKWGRIPHDLACVIFPAARRNPTIFARMACWTSP